MRILLLILLSISSVQAKENIDKKVESLMHSHLSAIKSKNYSKLRRTITDSYFRSLNKNNGIRTLFSMQDSNKKSIKFDIRVEKAVSKNKYFANIKDKKDMGFDHYWYRIIRTKDGNLKIDGTIFREEH
jgi:hypothetical protein